MRLNCTLTVLKNVVWPKTFLLDLLDQKYKRQHCSEFHADSNGIKIFLKFKQKCRKKSKLSKIRNFDIFGRILEIFLYH